MAHVKVAMLLELLLAQAVIQPHIDKVLLDQQSAKPLVQPTHIKILEQIFVKIVMLHALNVQFQELMVVQVA